MKSVGEILTWGVPEFLPPAISDLEIWELVIPTRLGHGVAGVIGLTRESATGDPIFQLAPGSDVTLHIRAFQRYHLNSTLSEIELRITDTFGSGRSLAYSSQNHSTCGPEAILRNSCNIYTAPQATDLFTQFRFERSGSGILCSGQSEVVELNARLFVLDGEIVATNSRTIFGGTWSPSRVN